MNADRRASTSSASIGVHRRFLLSRSGGGQSEGRPAGLQQVARLVDAGLPDGEHLFVRALVAPAEVAVANRLPEGSWTKQPGRGGVEHRLWRLRQFDARKTGPGEVLHPGSV